MGLVLRQLGHINFANQYWLEYQFIYAVWGMGVCEMGLCEVIKERGYFAVRKGKGVARNVIMFVLRFVDFEKFNVFAV